MSLGGHSGPVTLSTLLLTLRAPGFSTAKGALPARQSLCVRLTSSAQGYTSWGEATPLGSFGNRGSLADEAQREGSQALKDDAARLHALSPEALHAAATSPMPVSAAESLSKELATPAAHNALQCALIALNAQITGRTEAAIYRDAGSEPSSPNIPQPALLEARLSGSTVLDPSSPESLAHAERALTAGLSTFKVKCGLNASAELNGIEALIQLLKRHLRSSASTQTKGKLYRLRLDANLAFSLPSALSFLSGVTSALKGSPLELEWFEDPTQNLCDFPAIREHCLVAIDEPLVGLSPAHPSAGADDVLGAHGMGADVLILKPMALGGPAPCLAWAAYADKVGALVSLSHFFDGPIALRSAVQLGLHLQPRHVAAGLSLHQGLVPFEEAIAHTPDAAEFFKGFEPARQLDGYLDVPGAGPAP